MFKKKKREKGFAMFLPVAKVMEKILEGAAAAIM